MAPSLPLVITANSHQSSTVLCLDFMAKVTGSPSANPRTPTYLLAHDIVQNRFDRKNSLGYPIFPQNSHLSNSLSISSNVSKKRRGKKNKNLSVSKFLSASNSSYTTLSDQDFLTFFRSRATLAGLLLIPCFYIKMMVFFSIQLIHLYK